MNIIDMNIENMKPYSLNAKKHDDTQISNVAESIKQFGWKQPIVIDKDNVIVIGHCRYETAKKLGLKVVPVIVADELNDEQVRKLRLLDNKTNESQWDFDLLKEDLEGLDFDDFEINWGLESAEEANPYTAKVNAPQYQITGDEPSIAELYDGTKANELILDIQKSNVTKEEKEFLVEAAKRHVVFNYRNIAEYYAHAEKEMQELMEKSALVIIDYNDAIANGYVKLSKALRELRGEENA